METRTVIDKKNVEIVRIAMGQYLTEVLFSSRVLDLSIDECLKQALELGLRELYDRAEQIAAEYEAEDCEGVQ